MKTCVWISLVVVLIVASSSGAMVQAQSDDQAVVTLAIFSGMPDPTWTLSANQTETLRQILASLPEGDAVELPQNLGYRDFIIELDGETITIFHDHVQIGDEWRVTSNRALELWLLGTAGDALGAELTAQMWIEFTAPPPTFGIYLLAVDHSPTDVARADLATLALAPQPILSMADVIAYHVDGYGLELTPEAVDRLARLDVPVSGIPFVIVIDGIPVFPGAFWTAYSSNSYDESVVIEVFPTPMDGIVRLDLGYPVSTDLFTGIDWRTDPRLLSVFERAGKLR